MLTPYDYQEAAVSSINEAFEAGYHRPLIVIPTGGGKSLVIALYIFRMLQQYPEFKVVILAHRKELIRQNYEEFMDMWLEVGGNHEQIGIYSAGLGRKEFKTVMFAGIQSIFRKKEFYGYFDINIVDECFPAGTIINTPMGDKYIEDMRCGDTVYNASGIGAVEAVSIKPATLLFQLEFDDGSIIKCTENHPFFTTQGFKNAKELGVGERFFSIKGVSQLWGNFLSAYQENGRWRLEGEGARECLENQESLLNALLCEIIQSNEKNGGAPKNGSASSGNQTQTYQTWRQRAIAAFTSASTTACSRGGVGIGVSSQDETGKQQQLPESLQARHCQSDKNDWDRSGRSLAPQSNAKSARSQEDEFAHLPRLVNISRIQCESPVAVFNLQVSGHPSYFANGKLAHNCHLVSDRSGSMYNQFFSESLKENPYTKIVGLTATPFKGDGHSLLEPRGKNKPLFDTIAYEVPIELLLKENRLAHLITVTGDESLEADINNLSVNRSTGDFDESEQEQLMASSDLVDNHADIIAKQAIKRRKGLVFCVSKAHAQLIADALNLRHCSAKYLTSDHSNTERDLILEEFAKGKFKMLVNVSILTTGFNQKDIDLLVILRATQSYVLHWQIDGRGSRIHPSKWNESQQRYECYVMDFGFNTRRLGPIGAKIEKKIKGQERAPVKTKTCQNPECKAENNLIAHNCMGCGQEFQKECKSCGEQTAFKNTICHHCGKPTFERAISAKADTLSATANYQDQYKTVKNVLYGEHISRASQNKSFKITYTIGMLPYHEYWNFESGTGALFMAQKSWRKAGGLDPAPTTVHSALVRQNELMCPEKILLNTSGKFAQVVDKIYPQPKDLSDKELDEIVTNFKIAFNLIDSERLEEYLVRKYQIDIQDDETFELLDQMIDGSKSLEYYLNQWLMHAKTPFTTRHERTQLLDFASEDEEQYLDGYTIAQICRDHVTA